MLPAIFAGSMAIPLDLVRVDAITRTLTAKHCPMGSDVATLVEGFRLDDDYIYVPRQFGLDYCRKHHIDYDDQTSAGFPVEFPRVPTPRDYQAPLIPEIIQTFESYYDFIFKAHTGWGKCQKRDTPILMFDGSVKLVQDVCVGDQLMGPDSTPRTVLSLARGYEEMFDVIPTKGDTHTFNRSHILSLQATASAGTVQKGEIVDVSIDEYLTWSSYRKNLFKLWRTGVEFAPKEPLPYDPYFVGLYLGDGNKDHEISLHIGDTRQDVREWLYSYGTRMGFRVVERQEAGCTYIAFREVPSDFRDFVQLDLQRNRARHIPFSYRTASRHDRLQLLAGLIDTDGYLYKNCFDLICKDKSFAEEILFLARSLGLAAYMQSKQGKAQGWTETRTYYRIKISGDTDIIPVRTRARRATKRQQIKDVLRTGFTVESVGEGEYYGFTLDGDHRYLLGDFTVTHNTIGALLVAAHFSTTTVIVVDQDNLKDQWIEALATHFGMTVENGHVGFVQGKKWDYEGKSVVIMMVHTISRKEYPPEFYTYFGFAIFDEVHTVGAPTFSVSLMDFSAAYRLGVSATPKRKDSLQKLLDYNLGKIRVAAEKEHNESAVYVLEHDTVYSWYGNVSKMVGRIVNEVTEDGSRNLLIAETAISLYETGRDGLILSDRIEQLKHLQSLMYYLGVDIEQIGLYTGLDPCFKYAKEAKPQRRPSDLVKHDDDGIAHYTPVSLQLIAKRINKKVLAQVKESSGMILGTYGKCAKGFDEPRLKFGMDASPRGEFEQIHGRILREVPGQKMPIWTTIYDINNYRLLHSFARRIDSYLKSNGRIYRWLESGDLEECPENEITAEAWDRHRRLIKMGIVTNDDGTHTLVNQSSALKQKVQQGRSTAKSTPSRRRA